MSDLKDMPLADLLPPSLVKKLEPMTTLRELRLLRVEVLASEWRLTEGQHDRIQKALRSRGLAPLGDWSAPTRTPRAPSTRGKCKVQIGAAGHALADGHTDGVACGRPNLKGKRSCVWHWLLGQPIEAQIVAADQRAAGKPLAGTDGYQARVPESAWPAGTRWCSECQDFVPLFYVTGSKCKAHASRAAHASMIQRVYDLSPEAYKALFDWQGGRCYICQQVPRVRRLAVDHDHDTGEVRGLLCANDEWGCNVMLARLLNNRGMAERAFAYVTKWPLRRMEDGEDRPRIIAGAGAAARERQRGWQPVVPPSFPPAPGRVPPAGRSPFDGFLS